MATLLALVLFAQLAYVVYVVSSAFRTLVTKREIESLAGMTLIVQLAVAYFGGVAIEMLRSAEVYTISPLIDGAWRTLMFLLLAAIIVLLFAKIVGVRNAK
ncbi:hypothetical protein [Pannonibacter phragmitetus]|jgi:hypothetical protein|uniref:hypothetical protein n=1 Tax=Pannonibacter phragmitetus TaxID=121719 RepID=UPI000F03F702|nr:hypothetical protein [Pannonibacter phragmitetus]